MTHEEIESIVKVTAKASTLETLAVLGFNIEDPTGLRADMDHLRRWRANVEAVGNASVKAFVTLLVGGVITALWAGTKDLFNK